MLHSLMNGGTSPIFSQNSISFLSGVIRASYVSWSPSFIGNPCTSEDSSFVQYFLSEGFFISICSRISGEKQTSSGVILLLNCSRYLSTLYSSSGMSEQRYSFSLSMISFGTSLQFNMISSSSLVMYFFSLSFISFVLRDL